MKTLLIVISLLLTSNSSCTNKSVTPTLEPESPTTYEKIEYTEQLPILAWIGVPPNVDVSWYNTMKSAGFTHDLMTFFGNADEIQAGLDKAQQAGIKGFINCPELETDLENTVKRFMHHPALAGYIVTDEPRMYMIDATAEKAKRIQDIDSKHVSYVNLLGGFEKFLEDWIGAPFNDYFEACINKIPLQELSFSYYPISIPDGSSEAVLNPKWYMNLEFFSKKSKSLGLPLWTLVLASSHHHIDRLFPVPTIEALRLQVYSNLAYGSQVMQYYTYSTPRDAPAYKAPIAADGSKTYIYDRIKQVNQEIINLSGVFLGAEVVSVWHTGNSIPEGTQRLIKAPAPFQSIVTKGDGAVVSLLKNKNRMYLMIVNRSLDKPLDLDIKGNASIKEVDKEAFLLSTDLSKSKSYTLTPGDMKLFSWDIK